MKNLFKIKNISVFMCTIALLGCGEADSVSLSCFNHDVIISSINDSAAELVINGQKNTLNSVYDNYWVNENWEFSYDPNSGEYMILDKSRDEQIWSQCKMNLDDKCENVISEMNLDCQNYLVTATVCDDRAILNINDTQYVLGTDNDFYSQAKYSFLSGDAMVGFVIKDKGVGDIYKDAEYILKVNGNEYLQCTKSE